MNIDLNDRVGYDFAIKWRGKASSSETEVCLMKGKTRRILCALLALTMTLIASLALADLAYDGNAPVSAEKVTITALGTNGASLINDFDNMTWWKEVLKKANVDLQLEIIDPSSYQDVIKPRLAAGVDLPELVMLGGTDGDMSYINSGLFIDLKEYYDKYGFNYNKQFEKNKNLKAEITTPDGGMYYLPYIYTTESNMRCLMLNMQYLKALGMNADEIKTMDDYYNYLKSVKENDVNGNGDPNDEVPLFMRSGQIQLWGMYWGLDLADAGGFSVDKDGKVICGYIDDRYKEFLTWANKLYTEGLLYNEYATANYDMQTALFSNNQIGSLIHFISNCTGYSLAIDPSYKFNESEPIVMPIIPPEGAYGDKPAYGRDVLGGFHGITTTCEKPDVVFAFCDYLQSEEVGIQTWYGTEGVDYNLVDGEYVFTDLYLDNKDDYRGKSGYNCSVLPSYQLDYMSKECDAVRDMARKLSDYVVNPSVTFSFKFPEENEVINTYSADLKTYFDENMAAFIMGTRSLDEWDDYVASVKAMGVDDVIAVHQASVDRANAVK